MKTLTKTGFISEIRRYATAPESPASPQQVAREYDLFADTLVEVTLQKPEHLSLMRCLAYTRVELSALHRVLSLHESPRNTLLLHFTAKALSLVDAEVRLLNLRLRYPVLDVDPFKAPPSPLYWSAELTRSDLLEMICGLHALKAIRLSDGTPVAFSLLVGTFESFLNVKIPNSYRWKYGITNRKLKLTSFVDKIKRALIDLSQM